MSQTIGRTGGTDERERDREKEAMKRQGEGLAEMCFFCT